MNEDEPARYAIEYTDAAAEELGRAYLFQSQAVGPEAANRWIQSLRARVDDLATFPRRNERAPEYLNDAAADVRRLLVKPWRVLYQIIEPQEGEEAGFVRVLHVYHGARP